MALVVALEGPRGGVGSRGLGRVSYAIVSVPLVQDIRWVSSGLGKTAMRKLLDKAEEIDVERHRIIMRGHCNPTCQSYLRV